MMATSTTSTDDHSSNDISPEQNNSPTDYHKAVFVCPYCRKCTMEKFFSAEGCPQLGRESSQRKVHFPYLDLSGINEADRIDLEDRLKSETREIKLHFAKFTLNLVRSLEDLQIPIEKIKISILSLEAFTDDIGVKVLDEEDRKEIKAAKNLSEIFIVLQNYISFFNYHIIEHIIDQHGASRDHTWLEEYLEKFHSFCKRNIFEVPNDLFPSISRFTAKVFALKCTEGVSTMKGVEGVKGEIAKIFCLRPAALQLCSIKKGCVELHFLISAAVADHIFPVSPSQHSALSKIHIRVLICEGMDHTSESNDKSVERIPTVSFDGTHRQDAMQSRKQAVDTDSVKPSSNDPLTENKLPNSKNGNSHYFVYQCTTEFNDSKTMKPKCLDSQIQEVIETIPKSLTIPKSHLKRSNTSIGAGEFGIVYKGVLINWNNVPQQDVAIKAIKGLFTLNEVQSMVNEIKKMKEFNHTHVLSLIGVCFDTDPCISMVMPFMMKGSLQDYLKNERSNLEVAHDESNKFLIVRRLLIQFCHQIALGMEYITKQGLVHRDLGARNCMLDSDCNIKVGDFGLAEDIHIDGYFKQERKENIKLPFKWMALESLIDGIFTEKTDVWSYGVTMWEIFNSGRNPYPGVDPQTLIQLLKDSKRLDTSQSTTCSPKISSVMAQCWNMNPKERPQFSSLCSIMAQFLSQVSAELKMVLGCHDYTPLDRVPLVDHEHTKPSKVLDNHHSTDPERTLDTHYTMLIKSMFDADHDYTDLVPGQGIGVAADLVFLKQPKDVNALPGLSVELSITTSPTSKTYNWYFQEQQISSGNPEYSGSTTDTLTIAKCLSKHCGSYECVVTDETDKRHTSGRATLIIDGGELMKKDESMLLGQILKKAGIDFTAYGIDIEQLAEGEQKLSYEEIQYILGENSTTHMLSLNLKEELISRLEEENFYKEAMANDQKVSLSYTKILALGPGQVGKSTFLYRLMGLMKGNIQTADPKTQPQSSTGIAELREACITYTSRTGALTSESWQVFSETSDLQCQLDGLTSLLIEQAQAKQMKEIVEECKQPVSVDTQEKPFSLSVVSKQLEEEDDYEETDFKEQQKQIEQVELKQVTTDSTADFSLSKCLPTASYPIPSHSNIDDVIAEFERIQADCKLAPNKMKFRMLFNIADIGGQPAFLEMLPSLTIGPALYLVFMKLLQGLTTRYPVAFKCKDGRGSKLCKNYTYTSEEVIFTALSSIACFGNSDAEVEWYLTKTGDEKRLSSLAVLVGTFRDEIKNEKELIDIDNQLKKELEVTDFFKDGLIHSKSFLQVNNYSARENEIENHRTFLQNLLEKKFHKYDIPTRWLTLSICGRL